MSIRKLRYCCVLLLGMAMIFGIVACRREPEPSKLVDVSGHLPDLALDLTTAGGKRLDQSAFKGDVTLVYFGYTHCPDVCPETLGKLAEATARLGDAAKRVKVLFISVDPKRDTPALLGRYVNAFDAHHDVGATGSDADIMALAQRYRVAYQLEAPRPDGGYEVIHSSAVYIFDAKGRARLVGGEDDPVDAFVHDIRQLVDESP